MIEGPGSGIVFSGHHVNEKCMCRPRIALRIAVSELMTKCDFCHEWVVVAAGIDAIPQAIRHEVHRPGYVRGLRHRQRIRFVPLQPLAGFDPQVQFQRAIDAVDAFVVPRANPAFVPSLR